jgi:hypothetical protein
MHDASPVLPSASACSILCVEVDWVIIASIFGECVDSLLRESVLHLRYKESATPDKPLKHSRGQHRQSSARSPAAIGQAKALLLLQRERRAKILQSETLQLSSQIAAAASRAMNGL